MLFIYLKFKLELKYKGTDLVLSNMNQENISIWGLIFLGV